MTGSDPVPPLVATRSNPILPFLVTGSAPIPPPLVTGSDTVPLPVVTGGYPIRPRTISESNSKEFYIPQTRSPRISAGNQNEGRL